MMEALLLLIAAFIVVVYLIRIIRAVVRVEKSHQKMLDAIEQCRIDINDSSIKKGRPGD